MLKANTTEHSTSSSRVVESSWLLAKIAASLASIGQLLCLAFLYGWCFLNKISLDWPLTLTFQSSTSKLSDNPVKFCVEVDTFGSLTLQEVMPPFSWPLIYVQQESDQ